MPRRSTRRNAQKQTSVLTLLRQDHQLVTEMFEKYEKGMERMSTRQKKALAAEICRELTIHAQVEEELFYPALQAHAEDAEDILAEAEIEHLGAKRLIADIESGDLPDEKFDAAVTVLGEYIKHHVKEEHGEIFPKAREAEIDLNELGRQLEARKEEIKAAGDEGMAKPRRGTVKMKPMERGQLS
jgi:hemerythrin superfamily protein